jgi:hypothetical protein
MNHDDYQKAANHWKESSDKKGIMVPENLREAIDAYLSKNNTCAMATGFGDFVRCTPIEYTYWKKCLLVFQ